MLNLAERSKKKRYVGIEKKIGAADSCCMDQSYFRYLFSLERKSKQSGLSKSEKSLGKRNVTLVCFIAPVYLREFWEGETNVG